MMPVVGSLCVDVARETFPQGREASVSQTNRCLIPQSASVGASFLTGYASNSTVVELTCEDNGVSYKDNSRDLDVPSTECPHIERLDGVLGANAMANRPLLTG
jgi:hypothetical protein